MIVSRKKVYKTPASFGHFWENLEGLLGRLSGKYDSDWYKLDGFYHFLYSDDSLEDWFINDIWLGSFKEL